MIPTFQTQAQPTQMLSPMSAGSVSAGQLPQTPPSSIDASAIAKALSANPAGAAPIGTQGSGMPNLQAVGMQNGLSFGDAGAASQAANSIYQTANTNPSTNTNLNFLGQFNSPQWTPQ